MPLAMPVGDAAIAPMAEAVNSPPKTAIRKIVASSSRCPRQDR